jgi:hypothetical protein
LNANLRAVTQSHQQTLARDSTASKILQARK